MAINAKINTEKLSAERELAVCRAMMELSGDIAFEWDLKKDEIQLSDKWTERFALPSLHRNFSRDIGSLTFLHPDDLSAMMLEINHMRQGRSYGESVIRILDAGGNYTWNRIRAAADFDEAGKLAKVIGTIADVDSDKRHSQALQIKAEHDSLTGLLNKDTARRRAEQYLDSLGDNQCAAMLVIDLDNFKAVNDKYGHLFGDTVLNHVGSTIRSLFRESDILARIGGDEFLVIMRDIPDRSLAEQRCMRLTQAMQQLYGRQLEQCQFSCSVGMAFAPEHGISYQKLFQRADRALYRAKDLGKNTYAIFSTESDTTLHETKNKPRLQMDTGLVSAWGDAALHMLEQLYETQSIPAAFNSVLGMVGVQLQEEHVFLVDMDKNQVVMEWVHPHILPEGTYGPFAGRAWDKAAELFNDVGLFYCHDTAALAEEENIGLLQPFDASALLLCAVRNRGKLCGYVGMRSAFETRLWTQKEIDALGFLSRLASMFIWEYENRMME